jgi:purine-cytosine permease-like protein
MNPRLAQHIIAWFLRRTGFAGVALAPWGIFILAEHMHSQRLIRHEQAHWAQWQRMGTVRYYATYIWQVLRHGYRNAPMEIEARAAEQP